MKDEGQELDPRISDIDFRDDGEVWLWIPVLDMDRSADHLHIELTRENLCSMLEEMDYIFERSEVYNFLDDEFGQDEDKFHDACYDQDPTRLREKRAALVNKLRWRFNSLHRHYVNVGRIHELLGEVIDEHA